MNLVNNFLFIAFPYVAIVVFLVGAIHRYRATGFKYSSLSSQFLEGGGIYIFAVLFHWGILVVSSRMDIAIELLLIAQIVLGLWIALGYRWGYYWFASDMSPYLWSIVKFGPQIEAVSAMPLVIKMHIVGAFVILGMIPFTRLVHFLVAPFHYIWRPYQRVVWYWDRARIRDPKTAWSEARPRNN